MKALPGNNSNAHWQSDFVNELAYIRQHLSYKPKLSRLLPAIFSGLFIILLIITLSVAIYYQAGSGSRNPLSILMAISACIMFGAAVVRYLQSLKFVSIPSDYHIAENILLVQGFLKSRHLAFSQHPEIPEVYQILSRNISAGDNEDREVLLFIADDKRILINSHFTSRWSIFPRKRHHNEMAKMLKHYINNLDHSTGLMHQTF